MTSWSRREVLASLGVASGSAILAACGGVPKRALGATEINPEIRSWLRDAVSLLAGAGLSAPHALAVSRTRTTAALDVLGAGVGRTRCDGIVLSATDPAGFAREQVTNNLSREGVLAATRALAGRSARPASLDFGGAPAPMERPTPDPDSLSDGQLLARVATLAARDRALSSRIVYAANVLDVDDARVWSVAPGHMLEQRLVRVRKSVLRVAWHGSRPFVSEAARAWTGGIDALDLTDEEIGGARDNALALLTPESFTDATYDVILDPGVAAALFDAGVRTLMTSDAQRRPDVAHRIATRKEAGLSPVLTLTDDPTVSDAYGAMRFDDTGAIAAATPLVDAGRIVGRIDRPRRAGHIGPREIASTHLRVSAGATPVDNLLDKGMLLEGHAHTLVDPTSDRFVIQVARARELAGGKRTGKIFADVELAGELTSLFGSLGAVSKETSVIGFRDERDGLPRHRSIEVPYLRSAGFVRQRRRPT